MDICPELQWKIGPLKSLTRELLVVCLSKMIRFRTADQLPDNILFNYISQLSARFVMLMQEEWRDETKSEWG